MFPWRAKAQMIVCVCTGWSAAFCTCLKEFFHLMQPICDIKLTFNVYSIFLQVSSFLRSVLCSNLFVCFIQLLFHFQQSFSHTARVSNCDRQVSAQSSVPQTHDIIHYTNAQLTLLSWCWAPRKRAASTGFKFFGMTQLGTQPTTSIASDKGLIPTKKYWYFFLFLHMLGRHF